MKRSVGLCYTDIQQIFNTYLHIINNIIQIVIYIFALSITIKTKQNEKLNYRNYRNY